MTGSEAVTVLVALFQALGGWKVTLVFIFVLILPIILGAYCAHQLVTAFISLRDEVQKAHRRSEERYVNNVILVEQYEKMSRELLVVVKSNTESFTRLSDLLEIQAKRERK